MKLNKTIAILCVTIFVLFNISTAFATTGSIEYASGTAGITSNVTISGTVADTTLPVNIIVSDLSMGVGVNGRSIKYVNLTMPDDSGNWQFNFKVKGDIRNYDIKIRQDGGVGSVDFDEIESVTERIDANLFAYLLNDIINIDLSVANPELTNPSCSLYIAFYDDDDNLITADRIPVNGVNGNASFSDTFEKAMLTGAKYAKVFFWTSNMTPLIDNNDIEVLADPETLRFSLPENDALITKNPGKGWIKYGTSEEIYDPTGVLNQKVLDYSATGYSRYRWAVIEPEKGEYNWAPIDNAIEYWDSQNIRFAFGVMGLDTSNGNQTTPSWVVAEAQSAGEEVWTHTVGNNTVYNTHQGIGSVYLKNYENFLKALAERYDGDPRVEFIDVRSYGNYGEFHRIYSEGLNPIGIDGMKKHISMHTDYFKKTQIVVATGFCYHSNSTNTDESTTNVYLTPEEIYAMGVGVRNDAGYEIQEQVTAFSGHEPAILEQAPHYNQHKFQYGFDINKYIECFEQSKFSYMDIGEWGNSSEAFVKDMEPVIKYLTNKMGYHFVMTNASIPSYAIPSRAFDIDLGWINKGITYLYKNAVIDIALLDEDGDVVTTFRSSAAPTSWAPGAEVVDTVSVTIPENLPKGNYKLAVGIGLNDGKYVDDSKPDFEIGNYGKTDDKWYVFANAVSTGSLIKLSNYISEAYVNGTPVCDEMHTVNGRDYYELDAVLGALADEEPTVNGDYVTYAVDGVSVVANKAGTTLNINGEYINATPIIKKGDKYYVSLDALATISTVAETDGVVTVTTKKYRDSLEIAEETVFDSGFELNDGSWTLGDGASITTGIYSSGSNSLYLNGTTNAIASQNIDIVYENVYNVKFKVKSSGVAKLGIKDSNGMYIGTIETADTNGSWVEYSLNFDSCNIGTNVLGDPYRSNILTLVFESSSVAYIDDIVITKVGTYDSLIASGDYIRDYGAEVNYVPYLKNSNHISRSSKYAHSGTYSFSIKASGNTWATMSLMDTVILEGGAGSYTFEGYVRADDGVSLPDFTIYPLRYMVFKGSDDRDAVVAPKSGIGNYGWGSSQIVVSGLTGDEGWRKVSTTIYVTSDVVEALKVEHMPDIQENSASIGIQTSSSSDWGVCNYSGGTDTRLTIYFDDFKITKN